MTFPLHPDIKEIQVQIHSSPFYDIDSRALKFWVVPSWAPEVWSRDICFKHVKLVRFSPISQDKKRPGPVISQRPSGLRLSRVVPWKQVQGNAVHSCDADRGQGGPGLPHAIRKALVLSDRHPLWLCSPIRSHVVYGYGILAPHQHHWLSLVPPLLQHSSGHFFWKLLNGSFEKATPWV